MQKENIITKENILTSIFGEEYNSKKIIIFGASKLGIKIKKALEDYFDILYFCDNDLGKQGKEIEGKIVISFDTLVKKYRSEDIIVVIGSSFYDEISAQLKEKRIRKVYPLDNSFVVLFNNTEKLIEVYNLLADEASKRTFLGVIRYRLTKNKNDLIISDYKQYYHDKVRVEPGDYIVDGGSHSGRTAIEWSQDVKGNCTIFSFEPFEETYEKLKKNIKESSNVGRIIPMHAGLLDRDGESYLNIESGNTAGFNVVDKWKKESIRIDVIRLDTYVKENKIGRLDMIKYDIEGSEKQALMGGKEVIKKNAPKLQICLYHKPEDLFELPLYIEDTFQENQYEYYMGHHNSNHWETVLYALPKVSRLKKI